MINSQKLKERLKELGLSQSKLAAQLGVASSTMTQKINNVRSMSLDQAEKIAEILQISDAEFCHYFFGHRVADSTSVTRDREIKRAQMSKKRIRRRIRRRMTRRSKYEQ